MRIEVNKIYKVTPLSSFRKWKRKTFKGETSEDFVFWKGSLHKDITYQLAVKADRKATKEALIEFTMPKNTVVVPYDVNNDIVRFRIRIAGIPDLFTCDTQDFKTFCRKV